MDHPEIEIVFFGTGTSQGIPVIGCSCEVCASSDRRDHRYRTSVLIKYGKRNILIDVSPDFRSQMLAAGENDIDAILLTHEHNDHIIGMDDVRPVNFKHHKNIPVYGLERVLDQVRSKFHYAFSGSVYPGAPRLDCHSLQFGEVFYLFEERIPVTPLLVNHADLPILGFKIHNFVYITDANHLPNETLDQLKNLDLLIINALQREKHFSHYSLGEAVSVIQMLKPGKTYLIHMSHNLGKHADLLQEMPERVLPAHDNLRIKV